jgi:hypothetical protein
VKIEPALIAAIKAAAKNQPANRIRDHIKERADTTKAIKALCRIDRPLARAFKEKSILEKKDKTVRDLISRRGINPNFRGDIIDVALFIKSGGKVAKPTDTKRWSSEQVLARLAYAKPADRPKILAEYGIDWT